MSTVDTTVTPVTETETMTSDTETETDTDPTTTTGGPCMNDGDCGGGTPFCDTDLEGGTCVDCAGTEDGDAACAGLMAGTPACSESGTCEECTSSNEALCEGDTPVCGENNTCTGCTAHDQCPGGAGCHIFAGTCLPADKDSVITVEMDGDIQAAIGAVGTGTIYVAPGAYIDTLQIPEGEIVALLAQNPSQDTTILGTGGFAAITLASDATAYLEGLSIENISDAAGVESGGDVRLDECIIQSAEEGLISTGGRVHLENVQVIENGGVGVDVGGTEQVMLRNVIIAENGSSGPSGFVTSGATPFEIVYSTIALNAGLSGEAITSPSGMGIVRNSILIADATNLDSAITIGGTLMVSNSIVASAEHAMGNTPLMDMMDFNNLNLDPGTYQIGSGSTAQDVAIWMTGDPTRDINGVDRPNADGAMDYAGANIP